MPSYVNYGSDYNLNTHNKLKFKLYSSSSIQVLAKLEGGSAIEKWSDFSAVNTWQEFSYDFSDSIDNKTLHLFCFLMQVKITVIQRIFIILMNSDGKKIRN